MHRVRSYSSPVEALVAAMYLWRGGVPAGVIPVRGSGSLAPTSDLAVRQLGLYDVLISSSDQKSQAEALLKEMDAHPPRFSEGWEFIETQPDLARVDSAFAPACPGCARQLPMDETLRRCPACKASVDVGALIVQQHGPEVLADAYDHQSPIPDDLVREAPVPCPKCHYSLGGLPIEGNCPECGIGYRKLDIVRYWFG